MNVGLEIYRHVSVLLLNTWLLMFILRANGVLFSWKLLTKEPAWELLMLVHGHIYMCACFILPSSSTFHGKYCESVLFHDFMDFESATLSMGYLVGLISRLGFFKFLVPSIGWFILLVHAFRFSSMTSCYMLSYNGLCISCLPRPPCVAEDFFFAFSHHLVWWRRKSSMLVCHKWYCQFSC